MNLQKIKSHKDMSKYKSDSDKWSLIGYIKRLAKKRKIGAKYEDVRSVVGNAIRKANRKNKSGKIDFKNNLEILLYHYLRQSVKKFAIIFEILRRRPRIFEWSLRIQV